MDNANSSDLIRRQIGALIEQLLFSAGRLASEIVDIVVVGNTVMHHLFCGIGCRAASRIIPLSRRMRGLKTFRSSELGWKLAGDPEVRFLPCLGGFVGSDVLAGILATKLSEHEDLVGLVDLGTNGEIVIGNKAGLLCASTAAGPAFEGAKISMGMRASTGAISQVTLSPPLIPSSKRRGVDSCTAGSSGNVTPRGLCGSGLVDAVAAGLELGVIGASGRFTNGETSWMLAAPVALTQNDIRELQLAKGSRRCGHSSC